MRRRCTTRLTTIVFSLEMSKVRAWRSASSPPNPTFRSAPLRRADDITPDRWATLNELLGPSCENAPAVHRRFSPNMSLMEIRAKCRRLKQTNDLKLVVIDYLQLMTSGKAGGKPPAGGLRLLPCAEAARQGAGGAGGGIEPAEPWPGNASATRSRSCPTCVNPARSNRTPTWCSSCTVRTPTTRKTARARPTSSWRSIVTVRPTRSIWRSLARISKFKDMPQDYQSQQEAV